ncbi:Thiol:disulfide interchange protein DsbA [Sterolibacterium denitrificans]|uniref:Thiol:disulfide interchange protein DsbA n=1 Tax=Sterolibacterium denitrificans TaxID=157592 RepID=A0A7Z7HPA4_9PROT|nr:thiol:disulfide interchange protein DsbA/DsbL [Sterolibacterium denitrificans]SMB21827.1 Thiol:disulfide interchange protein DsbA [Sterolibacterium denitrificans]
MQKPARFLFRFFAAFCLALGLGLAGSSFAVELQEGKNFVTLPQPQPTEAKGKIEVTEFFWYGCPHCYEFEPTLNAWVKTLPDDVVFRRVPADFGRWTGGVRLYYTLQALGVEERLHAELFNAIHRERLNFNSQAAVGDWLAKKGVDRKRFDDAYRSFTVQANISRAQQLTRSHGLDGVPAVIVGGKYLTNNVMAGGYEPLPAIMNALIARLRAGGAQGTAATAKSGK